MTPIRSLPRLRIALPFLVAACSLLITVLPAAAAHVQGRIPLPNGFQPEGIHVAPGGTFYAGSLADGTILVGDVKSGETEVLVTPPAGRISVGLEVHGGYLFVAGGPTGAFVYDATTGQPVQAYDVGVGGFVNDVVVTRDAAWFTNSAAAELYRVPLSDGAPSPEAEILPLTGDFTVEEGFNLNGIEATANGRWLIAVQSNTGELFRIDPETGETVLIDLGGRSVAAGDGLLLEGRTLYVVRNQVNLVAVVRLGAGSVTGQLVDEIASPEFDVPTTVGRKGNRLYAVQARFATVPTPDTPYWVAVVPLH